MTVPKRKSLEKLSTSSLHKHARSLYVENDEGRRREYGIRRASKDPTHEGVELSIIPM